jgi:hypothetical protein
LIGKVEYAFDNPIDDSASLSIEGMTAPADVRIRALSQGRWIHDEEELLEAFDQK